MLGNLHITKDWTLFLDRDGIINLDKGYISKKLTEQLLNQGIIVFS